MLDNFPPLNYDNRNDYLRFGAVDEYQQQINQFLDNLTTDFLKAIEKLRQNAKKSLIQRLESKDLLSQACEEISYIKQLKQAIFRNVSSSGDSKLEEIIQDAWRKKSENSIKFQKIIEDFDQGNCTLDESIIIAKEVIEKVSNIQFFSNGLDLLSKSQLITSQFGSSQQLSVTKQPLNNYLSIENILTQTNYGEAFLNFIISPLEKYIINLNLQQVQGQDKNFLFGLGLDSSKNKSWMHTQKMSFCVCSGSYGINKQVKVPNIIAATNNSQEKFSFEVRIYLKEKLLRVGSLPNYESVVEIDNPNLIDLKQQYLFFIFLGNSQNKVTITKLKKVLEFDNKFD